MKKAALGIFGSLLFLTSVPVAFAAVTVSPLGFYCDPYSANFIDGQFYAPNDQSNNCTFTTQNPGPMGYLVFRGTPTAGGATYLQYGLNDGSSPYTLGNITFSTSGNPNQPGDPFFAISFQGDFNTVNAFYNYFQNGIGTLPEGYNRIIWHYGTSSCASNCNSNVMFLPGIEGSRLYDTDNGETKLWESNDQGALQLAMNPDGTSQKKDVYTKDVLDTMNIPLGPINVSVPIYKSLINSLNSLVSGSNSQIGAWEAIPYDWRLQLDQILASGKQIGIDGSVSYLVPTSTPYIIQELKKLAATSRTGKVTIIAHSNGGLVAKELTEVLGPDASKYIDKIIFVAVPSIGSASAVEGIVSGKDENVPSHLSSVTERYLSQNFPAVYNLLPSTNYFTQVDDPVISFDPVTMQDWIAKYGVTAIHSSDRLSAFMLDQSHPTSTPTDTDLDTPTIGNSTLFNDAVQVHENLDTWTPPQGIQFYQVAGWGNDTLSGITYRRDSQTICINFDINGNCIGYRKLPTKLTFVPNHVVDGDGTVVTPSALWAGGASSTRYWLNLLADGLSHYNLFQSTSLLNLISNIVTGSNNVMPAVTTAAPASALSRLHFTLHSPLTLGFVDSSGNYAGSTATTTVLNVPGVEYERYGDVQWLSIPADMAGSLVMYGLANGSFSLDIQQTDSAGTIVATTSFEGVASATSTSVQMTIMPNQSPVTTGVLNVDFNGDGVIDYSLNAKQNSIVLFNPPMYQWGSFLQPITDTAHQVGSSSVFKAGSTVPVKFQLKNLAGIVVEASTSPLWLQPQQGGLTSLPVNEGEFIDPGVSGNTFSFQNGQYHYNWSTKGLPSGYWYKVFVELDDGEIQSVIIGLN